MTQAIGIPDRVIKSFSDMSFIERIESVFFELLEIFRKKNKDYGDSINILPMFNKSLSVSDAIKVRLGDKVLRLQNLMNSAEPAAVKDETIEDTLKDLINYSVALLISLRVEKSKR